MLKPVSRATIEAIVREVLRHQASVADDPDAGGTVRDLLALKRRLRLPDARFGDDQPPTQHAMELDHRVRTITACARSPTRC